MLPARTVAHARDLETRLVQPQRAAALRRRTGIQYDDSELGILHLHTDFGSWTRQRRIELMHRHGFEMELKTAKECLQIEPALRHSRVFLAGGTYSPSDESGDAHLFSRQLEDLCRGVDVVFFFQTTVQRLLREGDRITGVRVRHVEGSEQILRADAYLVSLGSYTPMLVEPVGVSVPVYPIKGYSVTIPIRNHDVAPRVCLTDEGAKLAMAVLKGESCRGWNGRAE
jgi:D-amino-acid dehydrogenase